MFAMRLVRLKKFELLVSLASMAMLGYLVWYGLNGARGYPLRNRLAVQLDQLKAESATILGQRQALEARVTLLRPESIDPDYLDELARRDLFLVKSSDVIVAFAK